MDRPTLAQRFWAKVDKRQPSECWPWTGARGGKSQERGHLGNVNGRHCYAPRVSWMLEYGFMPPSQIFVCHTCDNPLCVNPAHLWLGTHQDNVNDMRAKGRGTGNRGDCRRGHALVPGNLLRMGKDERGDQKWGCRECNHLRIAAKQRGTQLDRPAFCPPVDAARTTVTHSDPLLKRGVA